MLFGEILTKTPDPFPFWHSSQKKDPGLNLSSYESKKVDKLLEKVRKEMDSEKRSSLYEEIQTQILADFPAIFLYDVNQVYFASKKIKGIIPRLLADPSERFSSVGEWYINTKRIWAR